MCGGDADGSLEGGTGGGGVGEGVDGYGLCQWDNNVACVTLGT